MLESGLKTVVINGVYSVRLLSDVFLMVLGSLAPGAPRVTGFMLASRGLSWLPALLS